MFKMSYFDPVFSTRSIQEKSPSSEFIQIGNYIYRKSQVEAELMNQLSLFCDSVKLIGIKSSSLASNCNGRSRTSEFKVIET